MPDLINEHENRLIRIEIKLNHLCNEMIEMKKDLKEVKHTCGCRLSDCDKRFVSSKIFYWIIPIMFAVILSIAGLSSSNKADIFSIKKDISYMKLWHDQPLL